MRRAVGQRGTLRSGVVWLQRTDVSPRRYFRRRHVGRQQSDGLVSAPVLRPILCATGLGLVLRVSGAAMRGGVRCDGLQGLLCLLLRLPRERRRVPQPMRLQRRHDMWFLPGAHCHVHATFMPDAMCKRGTSGHHHVLRNGHLSWRTYGRILHRNLRDRVPVSVLHRRHSAILLFGVWRLQRCRAGGAGGLPVVLWLRAQSPAGRSIRTGAPSRTPASVSSPRWVGSDTG